MSPGCLVEKSGVPKFVGALIAPKFPFPPTPGWGPVLCNCLSWMGTEVGAMGCNVLAGQQGALPGFRGGCSEGKQSHHQWLGIQYTERILYPENFQVPQIENRWKFKLWQVGSSSKLLWSCSLQFACCHLFCCDLFLVLGARQESNLQPVLLPHQECFGRLRVTQVRFCSRHTVPTLSLISVMLTDLTRNLLC